MRSLGIADRPSIHPNTDAQERTHQHQRQIHIRSPHTCGFLAQGHTIPSRCATDSYALITSCLSGDPLLYSCRPTPLYSLFAGNLISTLSFSLPSPVSSVHADQYRLQSISNKTSHHYTALHVCAASDVYRHIQYASKFTAKQFNCVDIYARRLCYHIIACLAVQPT